MLFSEQNIYLRISSVNYFAPTFMAKDWIFIYVENLLVACLQRATDTVTTFYLIADLQHCHRDAETIVYFPSGFVMLI